MKNSREDDALQPSIAPAVYYGWQDGTARMQGFELWLLTQDIDGHPAGSSVSRRTLEEAGYCRLPSP